MIAVLLGTKPYIRLRVRATIIYARKNSLRLLLKGLQYNNAIQYFIGYETVAIGDLQDLASDDDTDLGSLDEDTKETIRARTAAAAADAAAAEDAVAAETPER